MARFSAGAVSSKSPLRSSNVSGNDFTAKSTLASSPSALSSEDAPGKITAPRAELRLTVETEACDEKRLVTRIVRSELLKRRRT